MSNEKEIVSGRFTIKKIVFYDKESYFGIFATDVVDLDENSDTPVRNSYGNVTISGELVTPTVGQIIDIVGEKKEHAKYGIQYQIISVKIDFNIEDPTSRKQYLETIFSPLDVDNMYDALDDPFQAFMDEDTAKLIKVHGFGLKNVQKKINLFKSKLEIGTIITGLADFDLTMKMCAKLLDTYKNADMAVQIVKENPYRLIDDVDGIGWKKADMIAMKNGMNQYDVKRVEAFMQYYMSQQGEEGNSWITPEELLGAVHINLGEDIPSTVVTDAIHSMQEHRQFWCNDDHTKLGLSKYYEMERQVAEHLIRLRDSENHFTYDNWEEAIHKQEEVQGWEYEEEQIAGIKACLENNVIFITGGAGTGKSSTVGGMLAAFDGRYAFVQCALAGRAASRLSEITGEEGMTIHRLLGAQGDGSFIYNEEHPVEFDIIIIDEVSMIGIGLILQLLKALKDGTKVIMLGDSNQLESIGSGNFAHDIMVSPEILTLKLSKIHRQAQKSGIITQSVKVSEGVQLIPKGYAGQETRGELLDFHIDAYEDRSATFYKIMQHVSIALENGIPAEDIEVIVPMKERGDSSVYELNNSLQDLINPKDTMKSSEEIVSHISKNKSYTFRVGDRVINRVNNYEVKPNIFNGNIGIITNIDNSMQKPLVVYFYGLGEVAIPRAHINNIHLAYAITCHSAQGSEFNNVIVGIDFNSYALLTRQWVYTAITRAKKDCILCCETSALRYAIMQNNIIVKQTHLVDCLYDITHVKL